MKRTLIICVTHPLPENIGANIRTMQFARFFRGLGAVDVAYTHRLHGGRVESGFFEHELGLKKQSSTNMSFDKLLKTIMLNEVPWPVAQYTPQSRGELLSAITNRDYDYILVRYYTQSRILMALPQKFRRRTMIDFDDIRSGSLYDRAIRSSSSVFEKLQLRLNRSYLIKYERKCITLGATLFCSEADRVKVAGDAKQSRAFVVPNTHNNATFETFDFEDGFSNANILLFVGSLHYEPNIDGLQWFVNSIFRRFRECYADGKLLVAGRSPSKTIRDLCQNQENVELYADPPDLKDLYKCCRAVIVPLHCGGGTRIKILEAALASRPVLTTAVGAEGLRLVAGRDYLVFEDANEFFRRYAQITANSETYRLLTQNAKQAVCSKNSPRIFSDAVTRVINELDGD
jgi:glycosyltransferase involved in cell wall biosynthesis